MCIILYYYILIMILRVLCINVNSFFLNNYTFLLSIILLYIGNNRSLRIVDLSSGIYIQLKMCRQKGIVCFLIYIVIRYINISISAINRYYKYYYLLFHILYTMVWTQNITFCGLDIESMSQISIFRLWIITTLVKLI